MVMRVKSIETVSGSASMIEFEQPNGQSLQYHAGQYLVLSKRLGDQQVQRCYSICTAPNDKQLCIAAKNTGGIFSAHINELLSVGDDLLVHGPYGQFCLSQTHTPELVLFAAGSGITPILSIARQSLLSNPDSKVILLYSNRSFDDMMFYPELLQLANAHPKRLQLELFLSKKDAHKHCHHGRIDRTHIRALLFSETQHAEHAQFYICGPQSLRIFLKETLTEFGVASQAIHYESFADEAIAPQGQIFNVALDTQQGSHTFSVAENQTLLEAAKQQGVFIPNACGEGLCGSCKIRIHSGNTQPISEDCVGLLHQEQQDGLSLACQCRLLSDVKFEALN